MLSFKASSTRQLIVHIQSSHALNELFKQLICNPIAFPILEIFPVITGNIRQTCSNLIFSFSEELLEINSHVCCIKIKDNKP